MLPVKNHFMSGSIHVQNQSCEGEAMSGKKATQRKQKVAGVERRGPRVLVAAAVVLSLFAAWTMLAYSGALDAVFRQKAKKGKTVSIAGLNSNAPSKEYIHAGGRLVATEESAQSCDTSNPTSDTDSDGIPNGVEPVEGRNPCLKDNDIFNFARLFAMQQYRDFLGREGDSGGINYWTNLLNAGSATRAQVIDSFFNSSEFQGSTAPVTRLYFAYFLRIPDYDGLLFWVNQYRQGATLDSISQAFAQSQEFINRYGALSNGDFVTLVYQNVLGRAPDPGGYSFWVNQLNSGGMTRGQVMLNFSESAENKQTSFNKVFVVQVYVSMLRRAADQSGFDFWVNTLNGGASGLVLIQGFLANPEYHSRFLP
jgi:Domain of unknown function (DUF4214)